MPTRIAELPRRMLREETGITMVVGGTELWPVAAAIDTGIRLEPFAGFTPPEDDDTPIDAVHESDAEPHHPVLVETVLDVLAPRAGDVIVDGTCGTGGHSRAILSKLPIDGRLIMIDRDAEALAVANERVTAHGRTDVAQVTVQQGNFRELPGILAALAVPKINGLVLDLGMSSFQLDRAERGFSFLRDGPLDMRMDGRQAANAATLVNERSIEELAHIIFTFGEERFARRIARRIVTARAEEPITTTARLARIVSSAMPGRSSRGRLHPATRTFQALRIAVNDELSALEEILRALPDLLAPNGRAVILAFHSLEDRLVKRAFADGERDGVWTRLTKKPVRPDADEVARNHRARSVKLRAAERR